MISELMSKQKRNTRKNFGPGIFLALFILYFILPSFAQDSNYYDVSDSNRPPSAFSICCCSKDNDDGVQVIYSCKYVESEKCPSNLKQYKTATNECPSNLIFTKYSPEQNQDSKDN